jgi:hypothetical protein
MSMLAGTAHNVLKSTITVLEGRRGEDSVGMRYYE